MFRRYHHGHSVGLGVLVGLLLTRHGFMLAVVSMLAGVLLGRTWAWWATKAAVLGMALRTAASDRRHLVPVYRVPRPRSTVKARGAQTDDIPF